jgi:hypothetical protein
MKPNKVFDKVTSALKQQLRSGPPQTTISAIVTGKRRLGRTQRALETILTANPHWLREHQRSRDHRSRERESREAISREEMING